MRKSKRPLFFLLLIVLLVGGGIAAFTGGNEPPAQEAETPAGDAHGHGTEEADSTDISDASAATMNIQTVTAGPAAIRQTIRVSGRMVLNQNRSAEVKARFAGIVRGVFKQVGDTVKRGDKLATVESNESLQVYAVPAPLDGVVLERTISVGDTASDAPIFRVADLSSLWAEFFIFAADMESVRQGQPIIIRALDGKTSTMSTLQTIQPTAEASSQTVLARAEVENATGAWRSGMTVQGDVVISEQPVALAVPTAAIQRVEGKDVVFVKTGTRYTATPVTLGRSDTQMTEITAGLSAGATVVSTNSFIVKADIGKAGAEHEH
ncbi:MAG: efflux RND transporter periplasmic adaptor subunit [Pseudomonadota bacterium]